jgi:hypothetical protein
MKPQLLLQHNGRSVWRVPHDHQRLWLEYWYRLDGTEFDVREQPAYTEYPRCQPKSENWDDWTAEVMAWADAQQQHHAEIIAQALDTGNLEC